ncbi:BAG domain-containing protein Samui isoform X1 [Drosophila sulfurigaster albostrigata]|uniref:BAG domain-containing protein Samui isoform X1 n=2 Tax=Drosophila sulfurigaster albostrigata TaxID=89887 RepID=UPI002D21DABA|nr:BAG domain-containing protein Samui isoform X1 [Drosophila sulfurigaster albostrigata]
MKPTVITANQASGGGNPGNGNGSPAGAGISIPINRDYGGNMHSSSPQQQQNYQHPQYYNNQQQQPATYGSPRQHPQQQQQQPLHHHQVPTNQQQHFQPTFGFEPDMDMDMDNMFPRSRLGRMHHDPFAGFGGTRKRNSFHDPHHIPLNNPQPHLMHADADDDFSHYFDDAADFGFPQMSTMGRRGRIPGGGGNTHMDNDDDFFNRLPSEFRQYIPAGFGARHQPQQQVHPQQQQQQPQQQQHHPQQQYYQQDYQQPQQQQQPQPQQHPVVQSPSKRLCDAAIQTEDPAAGRSEVDCAPTVNLNQHGLRNTMDMGVKSAAEQDPALRSHSAPPPEQQQLNQQYQQQQHPHPNQQQQFGTQTTPPVQQTNYGAGQQQQPPQFQRSFYPPQQQAHPQQKQQTPPPPQTPGGSYVRTIPIFVEGRTEPIINAHKEIPNQNAGNAQPQAQAYASASAQAQSQPQAAYNAPTQAQRPGPLNTQAQPEQQQQQQLGAEANAGVPPQTPHTQDSIKKIQDIQRDVLELMAKVEQFKGTRQDKEYVYLDEMLTRNLLKLDTIDTNGKDSIRLARKEAIKCIQASVNVLDAKAEENGRVASGTQSSDTVAVAAAETASPEEAAETGAAVAEPATPQPLDATKIQEPIPLPPPPSVVTDATPNADQQPSTVEADGAAKVESETTTLTEKSE